MTLLRCILLVPAVALPWKCKLLYQDSAEPLPPSYTTPLQSENRKANGGFIPPFYLRMKAITVHACTAELLYHERCIAFASLCAYTSTLGIHRPCGISSSSLSPRMGIISSGWRDRPWRSAEHWLIRHPVQSEHCLPCMLTQDPLPLGSPLEALTALNLSRWCQFRGRE